MDTIVLLIPSLFYLLLCTSNVVHGHKCAITLKEIIKSLNNLTDPTIKDECNELTVADAFAVPKSYCPMHDNRTSTLKDFLERLKTIMKAKYSKCAR
ncbi:interleukin-4 [Rhynchocyon petersi]